MRRFHAIEASSTEGLAIKLDEFSHEQPEGFTIEAATSTVVEGNGVNGPLIVTRVVVSYEGEEDMGDGFGG